MKKLGGLALLVVLISLGSLQSCKWPWSKDPDTTDVTEKLIKNAHPAFSADSAYAFIKRQVDFGYRIPGTPAHKACADWLYAKLRSYCDTVYYQKGTAVTFNGKTIPVYNLIGSFKPGNEVRGLFCAHWDTRPFSDMDPDSSKRKTPVTGANDGGSGVGVLLEMARQLKAQPPVYGVDIIFFDSEDYGSSEADNSFCLGSQYWGKNLHKPNYKAQYGVLLDMVGGKDALFGYEQNSNTWANWVLTHTWAIARELGHDRHFSNQMVGPITDDHVYVHSAIGVPIIDIIQFDPAGSFASYWHTTKDDMSAIDVNTLQAIGSTMTALVYNPPLNL